MQEYRIYTQSCYNRACGHYESYGIALFIDGELSRIIGDISLNRTKVEKLAVLFNREDLDPVHFEQAVDDFLTCGDI